MYEFSLKCHSVGGMKTEAEGILFVGRMAGVQDGTERALFDAKVPHQVADSMGTKRKCPTRGTERIQSRGERMPVCLSRGSRLLHVIKAKYWSDGT